MPSHCWTRSHLRGSVLGRRQTSRASVDEVFGGARSDAAQSGQPCRVGGIWASLLKAPWVDRKFRPALVAAVLHKCNRIGRRE